MILLKAKSQHNTIILEASKVSGLRFEASTAGWRGPNKIDTHFSIFSIFPIFLLFSPFSPFWDLKPRQLVDGDQTKLKHIWSPFNQLSSQLFLLLSSLSFVRFSFFFYIICFLFSTKWVNLYLKCTILMLKTLMKIFSSESVKMLAKRWKSMLKQFSAQEVDKPTLKALALLEWPNFRPGNDTIFTPKQQKFQNFIQTE